MTYYDPGQYLGFVLPLKTTVSPVLNQLKKVSQVERLMSKPVGNDVVVSL